MIDERHFRASQELQKVMEEHGKELARTLKVFQSFSSQLSDAWKPVAQFGPAVSKVFGEYQKISSQLSESLKPLNDFTDIIQKNAAWLRTIDTTSFSIAIKNLRLLDEEIINMPESINPININPSFLLSPVSDDKKLKHLIKESIKELEEEEYLRYKKEAEEAAKKRKIDGFAHGKNKK